MSKTPVSQLQEILAKMGRPYPIYSIENIGSVNKSRFKCTVKFEADLCATGFGDTKQTAKHAAAAEALKHYGYESISNDNDGQNQLLKVLPAQPHELAVSTVLPTSLVLPNSRLNIQVNYVGKLNELASMNGHMYPTYKESFIPSMGQFEMECTFLQFSTKGYGITKKEAKQNAARKMTKEVERNVSVLRVPKTHISVEHETRQNERVIKEYMNLTKRMNSLSITSNNSSDEKIVMLDDDTKAKRIKYSLDEMEEKLKSLKIPYTLKTIQKDPFITCMIFGNGKVCMGTGETKSLALDSMLNILSEMIQNVPFLRD